LLHSTFNVQDYTAVSLQRKCLAYRAGIALRTAYQDVG
jgi:hypothetical protein